MFVGKGSVSAEESSRDNEDFSCSGFKSLSLTEICGDNGDFEGGDIATL